MVGQTVTFWFVGAPATRQRLKLDAGEIQVCLREGAYKAAITLSGSLIESLLTYAIRLSGVLTPEALDRMSFRDLAEQARKSGIIPAATESACQTIRLYRNLIHPALEERLGIKPDKETAELSARLVLLVVRHAEEYCTRDRPHVAVVRRYAQNPFTVDLLDPELAAMTDDQLLEVHGIVQEQILEAESPSEGWSEPLTRYLAWKPLRDRVYGHVSPEYKGLVQRALISSHSEQPYALILGWQSEDSGLLSDTERELVGGHILRVFNALDRSPGLPGEAIVEVILGHLANLLAMGLSSDLLDEMAVLICRWYCGISAPPRRDCKSMIHVLNCVLATQEGRSALIAAIAQVKVKAGETAGDTIEALAHLRELAEKARKFEYARSK